MRSGAGTSAVDLPSGESLRPPLAWLATRSGGDRQAKRGDDVREEEEERRARKTRLPRASLPPPLVRVAMGMGMGSGWARPLGRAGLVVRSGRAGPGACVVEDWIHHPTGSAGWLVGSVRCGGCLCTHHAGTERTRSWAGGTDPFRSPTYSNRNVDCQRTIDWSKDDQCKEAPCGTSRVASSSLVMSHSF